MVAWELGEPEPQRDLEADQRTASGNQRKQPVPTQGTIKSVLFWVVLAGKAVNEIVREEGTPNAPQKTRTYILHKYTYV